MQWQSLQIVFFEMSLLPEIYLAVPTIKKMGGIEAVAEEVKQGVFFKRSNSHTVLNAIGMGACYGFVANHSPSESASSESGGDCLEGLQSVESNLAGKENLQNTDSGLVGKESSRPQTVDWKNGKIEFPINEKGELLPQVWEKWKQKDPLVFLKNREKNLKQLKGIYLDVGRSDQYHLQYGSRQISQILKQQKVNHDYSEFDGNHFRLSERNAPAWLWLKLPTTPKGYSMTSTK